MQKNSFLILFLIMSTLFAVVFPAIQLSHASTVRTVDNAGLVLPMDEGSGLYIYDHSGNGNNFAVGGASWTADGLYYNSTENDYSLCVTPTGLGVTNTFTVEIFTPYWLANAATQTFISKWNDSAKKSWAVWANPTFSLFYSVDGSTTSQVVSSVALTDGAAYHLVVVFDYSGTGKAWFYVNGTYAGNSTVTGAVSNTASSILLGRIYSGTYPLNGTLTYARVYTDALSAAEVSGLYTYRSSADVHYTAGSVLLTDGVYNVDAVDSFEFSFAQVTDTQYLAESYPALFTKLTDFIAAEEAEMDVRMVVHSGDIVEDNVAGQWNIANSSFSGLLGNVPYGWAGGNHDQTGWTGSDYYAFSAAGVADRSYWLDSENDYMNTVTEFDVFGENFVLVGVEYQASAAVLGWLRYTLEYYADSHVIVYTHSYVNSTGGYGLTTGGYSEGEWQLEFNELLDDNSNVFLVLSGHDNTAVLGQDAVSSETVTDGDRTEIFWDRQAMRGLEGSCAVRFFTCTVYDGGMSVDVSTFDVAAEEWVTDADNAFSFSATWAAATGATTTEQDVNWMAFIVLIVFALLNVVLMLVPRLYVLNFVVGALTLAFAAATVNDATLPIQPYFSLVVALLSVLGILRAASLLRNQ